MSAGSDDRTLMRRIRNLFRQVSTLVQTERRLLRAELSEKAEKPGAIEVLGGAIFLLAALLVLLQALVITVAKTPLGPGWSSLLVGVLVAVGSVVLLRTGL